MTMNTAREAALLAAIPNSPEQYNQPAESAFEYFTPKPEQPVPAELATTTFGPLERYHPEEDAFMIPGYGAQPVPPAKYVPANDNAVGSFAGLTPEQRERALAYRGEENHGADRGQYIGLRRSAIDGRTEQVVSTADIVGINYADDENEPVVPVLSDADWQRHAEETSFAFEQATQPKDRGPFIQLYPARKFFPFDPRPDEVFIESIAHGLAHICRYSGAGDRHMSVAEHCTLIARYLAARYDTATALTGLLHDAPEALSGFGDVGRPVKGKAPIISETEGCIYRKAIAPRFGLPLDIPAEVHEADSRIIADEIAANLAPMEWQEKYDRPLGVNIRCWSPEKAEIEFLATFDALTGRKRGMA
ncbi:hypothetical protein [Rhizobium laguerreae]|uniref:hypothetical protein n=1 Tax=Rhizobium laguerreae TaxID=1076926 RepID=UPI001C8FC0EF|nr:hypothetical protein [Rhizobium laguerreae]MBY3434792.1 hypothetical protein [Rhizobium laguerreae]MBY3448935.1 hypothetical protein [Rhizobium laguerreae]MBY3456709.1 hypothetical protein [Rhizobium laguerreae]